MKSINRSFLFVPANRPERFEKALSSGCDSVIVDLEDAVPFELKQSAREQLETWLKENPDKSVMIRINAHQTEWFNADIALLKYDNVSAIVLPKTESPTDIQAVISVRQVNIYPIIETPLGFSQIREIAKAQNVIALMFGSLDFQLEMGMTGGYQELMYFRNEIVLASKLANIGAPIDGVTVDIKNEELLNTETQQAKNLGFAGKLCIHPLQINIVNQVFSPSEAEISWAKRVIEAVTASQGQAISLDGKMIDLPVIRQAEKVLQALV